MIFDEANVLTIAPFIHIMIVAVMDTKGNMKGILSQSSTLDYLMRHVRIIMCLLACLVSGPSLLGDHPLTTPSFFLLSLLSAWNS